MCLLFFILRGREGQSSGALCLASQFLVIEGIYLVGMGLREVDLGWVVSWELCHIYLKSLPHALPCCFFSDTLLSWDMEGSVQESSGNAQQRAFSCCSCCWDSSFYVHQYDKKGPSWLNISQGFVGCFLSFLLCTFALRLLSFFISPLFFWARTCVFKFAVKAHLHEV